VRSGELRPTRGQFYTFGQTSSRLAEEVSRAVVNSKVKRDELGLGRFLEQDDDQDGDYIDLSQVAVQWETNFVNDPVICRPSFHHGDYPPAPYFHSRVCFGITASHLERKLPYPVLLKSSSRFESEEIPIFLVDIDSPSPASLRHAIESLAFSGDKSPMSEMNVSPPLVLLIESKWSRENSRPEILVNCLAALADILNWTRSDREHGTEQPANATVLMLTTQTPASQDTAIREFARGVLSSRTKLAALLRDVESASTFATRRDVAAANIPKVVLKESGEYHVETIDSADTAYEDVQRRLLNTELNPNPVVEQVMLKFGWLALPLLDGLPMQKGFVETVLRGYVVNELSHPEDSFVPKIKLNELRLSLLRAMVRYGPLGFIATEGFEWRHVPDTRLCDDFYSLGQATDESHFEDLLQTRHASELIDAVQKSLQRLESEAFSHGGGPHDPDRSTLIELANKILAVAQSGKQRGSN